MQEDRIPKVINHHVYSCSKREILLLLLRTDGKTNVTSEYQNKFQAPNLCGERKINNAH
jgi:hypothetical protein